MDFGVVLPASDIGLRIRQPRQSRLAAPVGRGAAANLFDHAPVVVIEHGHIAAHVCQHILECLLSAVRLDMGFKEGLWYGCGRVLLTPDVHALEWACGPFRRGDAFHDIAFDIVLLWSKRRVFELRVEVGLDLRGRARPVVVVHEVHLPGAAVSGTMSPVVDHHIADVEPSCVAVGLIDGTSQRPVSPCIVCQQAVVEAADVAAYGTGIAVGRSAGVFLVPGDIQRLGDQITLKGNVLGAT